MCPMKLESPVMIQVAKKYSFNFLYRVILRLILYYFLRNIIKRKFNKNKILCVFSISNFVAVTLFYKFSKTVEFTEGHSRFVNFDLLLSLISILPYARKLKL